MKFEAGIVHECGALHAVQVKDGIELRVLSGTCAYAIGTHKGDPSDPAIIAKARTSIDRLARYPKTVERWATGY